MPLEIKYLNAQGEYSTLEIDSDDVSLEDDNDGTLSIASAKKEWSKTIASVGGIPELKMETCYKKIRIPGNGKIKVPYPCAYTRTGTHKLVLKVLYPDDLQEAAVNILIDCAQKAAVYAAMIIAPSIINPASIPAAIAAAQTAFVEKFKSCVSDEIFNSVSYSIVHEQESGPWHRV